MKMLGLSIVVALGLAIGLWWTREAPRAAREAPAEQPTDRAPVGLEPLDRAPIGRAPAGSTNATPPSATVHPRPELSTPERLTLEPTDPDPKRRAAQESLWQYLRTFAKEAELTDAQWDRFVRDLSELATSESAAWDDSTKVGGFEDMSNLNDELGRELEERIAAYMTDKQLRVFRFRLNAGAAVTQVRQLHFVAKVAPES